MLNFSSSEPAARKTTTFNQFSATFRRLINPFLINGRKNKTKQPDKSSSNQASKVYPVSSEPFLEISNLNNNNLEDCLIKECAICFVQLNDDNQKIIKEFSCGHSSCDECLIKYVKYEVSESRISITCPECPNLMHPNEIAALLSNDLNYLNKYEEFSIRKVLISDPKTRWCPSPDCNYAVIASSKCSKCPIIKCEACFNTFCYNCKIVCSPDHKCKKIKKSNDRSIKNRDRSQKNKPITKLNDKKKEETLKEKPIKDEKVLRAKLKDKPADKLNLKEKDKDKIKLEIKTKNDLKIKEKNNLNKLTTHDKSDQSSSSSEISITSEETSEDNFVNLDPNELLNKFNARDCPNCRVLIIKIEDGSCNHMTCSVCGTQFCWLCKKKTSELHYLSPTGCTFFGRRQWSKKKKIIFSSLIFGGAPVFILLASAIAVPSIIIGVPVWFGTKLQNKLNTKKIGKFKKCVFVTSGVISSALIAPILAAGCVSIGIPFLLAYIYGVVPITLCRSKSFQNDNKPNDEQVKVNLTEEEAKVFLKPIDETDEIDLTKLKNETRKLKKLKSKEIQTNLKGESSLDYWKSAPKDDSSIKAQKGSNSDITTIDFVISLQKQNKNLNKIQLDQEPKDQLKEDKIIELHFDNNGKALNRKFEKKLEVKSLENLTNLNLSFCEICEEQHKAHNHDAQLMK